MEIKKDIAIMPIIISSFENIYTPTIDETLTFSKRFTNVKRILTSQSGSQSGETSPISGIEKLLSSILFFGVGLISYSLYLWHYPIFAFARITEFAQVDIPKKIFLGIIILLLSILSYFFIERPARNKSNNFKIVFLLLSIFLSVLILANSLIVFKNGFRERMPEIINKNLSNRPWLMLTDDKGEICWEKFTYCKLHILYAFHFSLLNNLLVFYQR